MARCEDWPACGHESGCCPDFGDDGRQLNMICICGAVLPINNRSSICISCLNQDNDFDGHYSSTRENEDFEGESGDDFESREDWPDDFLTEG